MRRCRGDAPSTAWDGTNLKWMLVMEISWWSTTIRKRVGRRSCKEA